MIKPNRETVVVNLDQSEEDIWQGFASRNRNRLRNAEKKGFEMEMRTDEEAIAIFHSIYAKEMERKNSLEHYRFPASFFNNLFKFCEEKFYLLLFKYLDSYIGGILCAEENGIVHDFLRASLREYWNSNINNWMVMKSIYIAKENGNRVYDLQGGKESVFHFKSGFSNLRRIFYTYSKVHLPDLYGRLVVEAKKNGLKNSCVFFPKYRIPISN